MIATTYPLTIRDRLDRLYRIATQRPGRNTQVSLGGLSVQQTRGGAAAAGWWLSGGISAANCIAAYQPKGAASYAASKVNLANPGTYDATEGVAPSWNGSDGWIGNGSAYLDTGYASPSGASVIVRYSNAALNTKAPCGAYDAANKRFYFVDTVGGVFGFRYGALSYNTGAATSAAILAMTPTGLYVNGSLAYSHSTTFTQFASTNYILADNQTGAAANIFTGNLYAVAWYDIDIAAYISALTTAMAAL